MYDWVVHDFGCLNLKSRVEEEWERQRVLGRNFGGDGEWFCLWMREERRNDM